MSLGHNWPFTLNWSKETAAWSLVTAPPPGEWGMDGWRWEKASFWSEKIWQGDSPGLALGRLPLVLTAIRLLQVLVL